MSEVERRQLGRSSSKRQAGESRAGGSSPGFWCADETINVATGDDRPGHFAAELIGPLADCMPFGFVLEQEVDAFGDGVRIRERHQYSAAVGKQLFCVPVRCRDNRLTGADTVG